MNIIKFLDGITTENLTATTSSRRELFGTLGSISKKVALAAIPFGLATNKSSAFAYFGHIPEPAASALRLALTLEYLEAEFYVKALASGVLPGGRPTDVYEQISKHETAHVNLLESVLMITDDNRMKPDFDFTVKGMFDPFMELPGTTQATAYLQLLSLAQAFEDTGVRAYKGQAANLQNTVYLLPALQIHSVEARHASEVRRLRADYLGIPLNEDSLGWITLDHNSPQMPAATDAVYVGEDLIVQAGVNLTTDLGDDYSAESASQSFDEPITANEAVDIASLFIVS